MRYLTWPILVQNNVRGYRRAQYYFRACHFISRPSPQRSGTLKLCSIYTVRVGVPGPNRASLPISSTRTIPSDSGRLLHSCQPRNIDDTLSSFIALNFARKPRPVAML